MTTDWRRIFGELKTCSTVGEVANRLRRALPPDLTIVSGQESSPDGGYTNTADIKLKPHGTGGWSWSVTLSITAHTSEGYTTIACYGGTCHMDGTPEALIAAKVCNELCSTVQAALR